MKQNHDNNNNNKIKKGKTKNIALRMRTESSARSFFRSESVHDSISFLCERVTTLRWHRRDTNRSCHAFNKKEKRDKKNILWCALGASEV